MQRAVVPDRTPCLAAFQVGGDAPGDPHLPCPLILERLLGWIQDRSERLVAGTGEQIEP